MPQYYFHVEDGGPRYVDKQGVNLPGIHAAQVEATKACAEMLREMEDGVHIGSDLTVEVGADDGPLFCLHVEAVPLR